jgi:hypothetical protein
MSGLAVVVALTLAGCGGGPAQGNVMLALGSAHADGTGFTTLDGPQTLVPGAQGGFHVWVKYRVHGMAPTSVPVHRTARRVSDGALVLTTDAMLDVGAPGADGWWELPDALPNFICPTPLGVDVIGQELRIDVQLQDDKGGTIAESSATPTVGCPSGDEAALCMRICSG